jgi:FdhD protein
MNKALQVSVVKINGDSTRSTPDLLAIEEPLEIRLAYSAQIAVQDRSYSASGGLRTGRVKNLAVTMRTPGHDADLALGFLFTEGIIAGAADIKGVDHTNPSEPINPSGHTKPSGHTNPLTQTSPPAHISPPCSRASQNSILVTLHDHVTPNLRQADRNFYTTSSCGVCGKTSIGAIRTVSAFAGGVPGARELQRIDPDLILALPGRLAKEQEIFAETGGLHAAALFDRDGSLHLVREDVGRHNAVDKLIGAAMMDGRLPLTQSVLLLSGRASFELVQKAAMAGIPVTAAVGAPSSLAVSLAEEFGMTLIGFLRNDRFNIYSGAQRVYRPAPQNMTI